MKTRFVFVRPNTFTFVEFLYRVIDVIACDKLSAAAKNDKSNQIITVALMHVYRSSIYDKLSWRLMVNAIKQ